MVREALGLAGSIGGTVGLRTIVFLRIRVGSVPEGRPAARSTVELLPGGERKRGEKGWIDEDHMACQGFEGPLEGRAAGPGYRLREDERRPEDLEFPEDMLYTAAIRQAGYLVTAARSPTPPTCTSQWASPAAEQSSPRARARPGLGITSGGERQARTGGRVGAHSASGL